MVRRWILFLLIFFFSTQCFVFQKSVKITPANFEYDSIAENYFSRGNEKPFPLTVQRGNNLYNSTTQDGRYLFYTTDHSGNYDIWFRDLRSAIIVPVTTHPAAEYKPAISPNGKKLVFVSEENDSAGDIVLINLSPTDLLERHLAGEKNLAEEKIFLTNPNYADSKKKDNFVDTDPAWSPNGKHIVFATDRFTPGLQNLALLDTSNPNQIIQLTMKGAASPQFSFDGKSIVYLSFQDSKEGEIYRLNLESKTEERLTNDSYMNFSPSLSPDGNFLYFTSIRKDTNKNQVLDTEDNSLIIKLDLTTKEEKILTTDNFSVFDTKFSFFNKGSILFSAALYNTINIYFIPESGPIPKKANIDEQFNFALRIKKTQDNYFLALDSLKLFFEKDPLFSIYEAKAKDTKIEFKQDRGQQKEAKEILDEMLTLENDPKNALSYAMAIRRIARNSNKSAEKSLFEYYERMKGLNADKQVLASILKLVGGEKERSKNISEAKEHYQTILKNYPDYFEKREVKRKLARLEFNEGSITIPELYFDLLNDSSTTLEDLRLILNDLETKISANKNYIQKIEYTDKLLANNKLKERSKPLYELVTYIKSKALSEGKKFQESNTILDSFLEPVKKNPDCDINPFCQKLLVCVKNPVCLKSHLLKSKNFEGLGSVNGSFDELRVFLENYDPDLGVELNKTEIEKTFRYYENKARDHEARGNSSPENRIHLRDAAFHYFFNVENMYLLKEKNLFVEDLYKDYAVYYQRKMVDSIFNYAEKQAQDNREDLLAKLNVLGDKKLNVFGRVTLLLSNLLDNRVTNKFKFLGDFRDLKQETILGKPGEPDDALKIIDAHFVLSRPRARPVLYLASLYGYAYYLINKSLIYETHYRSTNTMTPARKETILKDLRNAENELKWIIFADPQYADAHQLLGWLYQYIDIFKSTKPSPNEPSDGEVYADIYAKFFSEKHFEENINLYKQVLDMLGNIQNKKILSDLNLNLANNYLLLQNYPKAKEHYTKVETYGQNILDQIQFENYKQAALFNYHYARSLISMGEYQKASQYLKKTAEIYYDNEYYEEVGKNPAGLGLPKKKKEKVVYDVHNKLVLIYSLLGLSERESGNYINAINAYKKAIALNYNSGYVENINLYSSLALCYQKVEKYHLSNYYISKVETEYKKYKAKQRFKIPSLRDWFWNLILPDRVRVIGDGRFPGEFAPEEHYLLAQGIKIQNLSEEGDLREAEKAITERDKFLKDTGLNKLIIGEQISLNAKYKIGYDNFIRGRYEKALNHYDEFLEQVKSKKIPVGNQTKEKRKILKRKSFTLFRLIESAEANQEYLLPSLSDNINDLNSEKNTSVEACLKTTKQTKQENDLRKFCEDAFHKEWYVFDPLLGLSYYYLGEVYNQQGNYSSAFHYYGLAIPLLKDPASIPVELVGLPGDLFSKTERLRLKINLANVYYRIGDEKQFKAIIGETEELSSEFQAMEDLLKVKLLKAKFLFQKAKTKNDFLKVLEEIDAIEKGLTKSYATLIDLEDGFFYELFSLSQETHFKLGNWKEILSKEEKLYSHLLFNHFQNTRIVFDEEKLEGLNQYLRDTIQKDLENNNKYKVLVNTRKPLSTHLQSRVEITKEVERVIGLILKFFPEKKRFFEMEEATKPETINPNESIIRFKKIQNSLVVSELIQSKESFSSLPIQSSLEETLSSFFARHLEKAQTNEITIIPDKSFANLDFKSIPVKNSTLGNLVNLNYALTMRQVNPITHKSIQFETIVDTVEPKEGTEPKPSKRLGPILSDSDVLNTKVHYTTGNVFTSNRSGFINLKEFAEKDSTLSLVILNQTKLDDKSFFKTVAAIDSVQSTKVPLLILGGDKPIKINKVIKEELLKENPTSIGWKNTLFENNSSKKYLSVKEEAFKWERQKKYREAIELFQEANTLVNPADREEKLQSEINLARIKSKGIPKTKRFVFFERLIKKYQDSNPEKITIYEALLHQCYVHFSNTYCRDHFKNYYRTLKSSELDSESKERSKLLVNFYIQVNNGSIQNLEKNYQNFLKNVNFEDLFLFHEDMSDLFIKNFILDKAEFHTKQLIRQANTKEEKQIALQLENEIELLSYFSQKSNNINPIEVTESIYKDGILKNWNQVEEKIKSLNRRSYDDVLIKYRQRLFSIWKDIHSGREINPLQLISETTSTGKSVYSILSQVDRALLFHLLLNSIPYQTNTEVNTVFDALLENQKEESKKIQNLYLQMSWSEELLNRGDFTSAEKYLSKLETDLNQFPYDHSLETRFHLAKFKLLELDENARKNLKPANPIVLESEVDWYPLYKKAKNKDINSFIPMLNEILAAKSDKPYDSFNKREFLDFITYLQLKAFQSNSSEVFLDLAFYKDKIEDLNRLKKESLNFSSLPQAEVINDLLLKKIPKGQEFIAVVNFGLQTFSIKIENGKSNGELSFADYRPIKNEIYSYYKQVQKKGSGLLLKDSLEPKFRNKILLKKNKLTYIYLSSFFIKAPLELKEEDNFYIVQNPALLSRREIRKSSDFFQDKFPIKKFKDLLPEEKILSKLENLEITERTGSTLPVILSGERLFLASSSELQFGKNTLSNLQTDRRKGVWFLSNSDLYSTSFFKDDLNIALNYLDQIHHGPGIFSLTEQSSPANVLFIKTLLQDTQLQTNLKPRFLEAIKTVKARYPQEAYWHGYRLYTNTLLEE
ncbi:MAG TPA: hypothetical protein PK079_07355 [Leptospiraceae bacterium]|nr:hypothetical protein [Leptospiraceae bacterium]HMX32629.1 hypothetical protein [Leptospiraceae bacterium]HMY33343.1 hypothetical protein [Leptospiraceae bacterium]HMZ66217.1 hypothetical protein [Leptospiraceae bacterium]HNA07520.1 hypothetical protein [Leptospiraceae bacterium]